MNIFGDPILYYTTVHEHLKRLPRLQEGSRIDNVGSKNLYILFFYKNT